MMGQGHRQEERGGVSAEEKKKERERWKKISER